eukprot:COSAG02_NODE_3641_length_6437_cov_237.157936_2_plen_83_part_00
MQAAARARAARAPALAIYRRGPLHADSVGMEQESNRPSALSMMPRVMWAVVVLQQVVASVHYPRGSAGTATRSCIYSNEQNS